MLFELLSASLLCLTHLIKLVGKSLLRFFGLCPECVLLTDFLSAWVSWIHDGSILLIPLSLKRCCRVDSTKPAGNYSYLPPRPNIFKIRASKVVDWHFLSSQNSPIDGFLGSEVVKSSARFWASRNKRLFFSSSFSFLLLFYDRLNCRKRRAKLEQ